MAQHPNLAASMGGSAFYDMEGNWGEVSIMERRGLIRIFIMDLMLRSNGTMHYSKILPLFLLQVGMNGWPVNGSAQIV